jgi:Polysaccharide deacetylase/Secretion system C-terminal sorting domain
LSVGILDFYLNITKKIIKVLLNFSTKILLAFILTFSPVLSNSLAKSNDPLGTETIDSTDIVWAAKWYNDNKSAFSFSFDDGFISHYENVRPILNQFYFKGTFYVMPPFLTDNLPGIFRYGTWPMFQVMALEEHEIASHTMNHLHLPQLDIGDTTTEGTILFELYQSQKLIKQRLPNQQCITMAYPFAEHNEVVDSLTALFYESARADGDSTNPSSLNNEQWFSLSAYEVQFDEPRNTPEDDLDELQSIQIWIDSTIIKEDWGILLGHEVVPYDSLAGLIGAGAWNPYSNEWFAMLCEWIWEKSVDEDIWVETIANVTRYVKERDAYSYTILTYNENQIKLNLFDDLSNEIYNYPLSLFIKVPENWDSALLIQNERIDTLNVFTNDSGKVVLANIIPDDGDVSLFKMNVTGVEDLTINPVEDYKLFQNYPNPFNPSTRIQYAISRKELVTLNVYDVLGREVATLVNEEKTAGSYEVSFKSSTLSSGVYIYTLRVGNKQISKKMVVAK